MSTDVFITPDNVQYVLNSRKMKSRVILTEEGTGSPDSEFITVRGPFQHGETLIDYFLKPRIIQLMIRGQYCDLDRYWNGRARLLDILRPNRIGGPEGTLRKILPNGEKRDLKVVISEGPKFTPHSEGWDEWAYTEVLRFIAHNPIYYNPVLHSLVLSETVVGTFPITFPLLFFGFEVSNTINYLGNWEEYPTIRIDGPITDPTVQNVTTDEKLELQTTIGLGEYVTYTLNAQYKTILRNDGADMYQYLSTDSDLATFHLQPGNNEVKMVGVAPGVGAQATLTWYDRYYGI